MSATTNAPPSRNPSNNDSMPGLFEIILGKFLQNTDDMLPAKVVSYNASTNRAVIQPQVNVITTAKEEQVRDQVKDVPVVQIGLGGFVLRFPCAAGNTGYIKANDRDISLYKATIGLSPPNTYRKHSFNDAVFIPDTMLNGVTIATADENSACFQNLDGSVLLALAQTYIKLIAPAVGIGGQPNAHAILDLQSTTKAFILPRMTTAQRDAIPSPVEGMEIWNLDVHGAQSYNGSIWG